MPKGSNSCSESVHIGFGGMHDTSTSTINSLGSVRSNSNNHCHQTAEYSNIESVRSVALNEPRRREYSNFAFESSQTSILSKFLNGGGNIETDTENNCSQPPAYENLCNGCGYGVFEARGKLCNFCQYVLNGYPYPLDNHNNTNIYENICDKCSQLYTGDECLVCLEIKNKQNNRKHDNNTKTTTKTKTNTNTNQNQVKSSSKKLKKRLFNSLLGSLKRVKSFNSGNLSTPLSSSPSPSQTYINNSKSPNRKLQIVHNVDGFENVFRTNETFDLNRICELRQQLKVSSSDHHIYGKLRKSDDHLHHLATTSMTPFECIKQKSQSDDYLISGNASDRDLLNLNPQPQSRSISINSRDSVDDNLHYLTSIQNISVSEWMTSLRCETHDYYSFGAPDTVLSNPKSIPGNFSEFGSSSSSYVISPRNVIYTPSTTTTAYDDYDDDDEMQSAHATIKLRPFSEESSQAEFAAAQQMVNEFKRNLMEKPGSRSAAQQHLLRTKRQGIYLKLNNTTETNRQRAENNYHHQHQVDDGYSDDLDVMVGDHQPQRNDRNCLMQSSAQAQAVGTDTRRVADPATSLTGAGLNVSQRIRDHQSTNKRCCIYEKDSDFVSDILQAFDSFLLRESDISPSSSLASLPSASSPPPVTTTTVRRHCQEVDVKNCEKPQVVSDEIWLDITQQATSGFNLVFPHQIDLEHIVHNLVLSKSLNKIVINYEFPLKLFLSGVDKSAHLSQYTFPTKKKIFYRFRVFLCKQQKQYVQKQMSVVSSDQLGSRSQARLLGSEENSSSSVVSVVDEHSRVPRLFSSTPLPLPAADSLNSIKMTVPNNGISSSRTKAKEEDENEEEPIYQPIWKFKTVGEVQETDYITDAYYDHDDGDNHLPRRCDSSNYLAEGGADIEDHDEWEPDDEFTFTTKLAGRSGIGDRKGSGSSNMEGDTISVNTIQSSSGSTITGYASSISTMTLASTTSSTGDGGGSSVTHHILRNICIFYSPKDPKIRAVLYEYDRNRCSSYFAQQMPSPPLPLTLSSIKETRRGGSDGSTSSSASSTRPTTTASADYYDTRRSPCDRNKFSKNSGESGGQILADSVQAWKYLLLDVNYLEDEEDMIVSESQILRAQTIKEMDSPLPPVGVLQRFKSISSGNLLDVPAEEDKKSITERVRNKLQRGVFKLHPRSPKEGKKSRNLFRRNEATSLYLEDGMKPKYPIFKAPLEFLEMNETSYPDVPRFVVDCIEYIEQKDCIQMDGLYRASGNKVAIDELKQKLTESYIYDPKLLVTDDIHTLTSLLKMFFRELASPLIPEDTYKRLAATRNLMEPSAIENMRIAFQEMKNPNRDTLKFLIKHLTTVAHFSSENRMPASNLAIVWGPCILSANQIEFDIARMNTIAKVLIENYDRIFGDNERLVS